MALADFAGAIQWYDTTDDQLSAGLERTWTELSVRGRCHCEVKEFSAATAVLEQLRAQHEGQADEKTTWRVHIRSDLTVLGRAYEGLGQPAKAAECKNAFDEFAIAAAANPEGKATAGRITCNICYDEKLNCDIVDVGGDPYVGSCCLVCFRLNEESKRAAAESGSAGSQDEIAKKTAPFLLWNPRRSSAAEKAVQGGEAAEQAPQASFREKAADLVAAGAAFLSTAAAASLVPPRGR